MNSVLIAYAQNPPIIVNADVSDGAKGLNLAPVFINTQTMRRSRKFVLCLFLFL